MMNLSGLAYMASVGYNPTRLARGWNLDDVDVCYIFSDLTVMDFGGPNHQVRLLAVHPWVSAEQAQEAARFPLHVPAEVATTPKPTPEHLDLPERFDPHDMRANALED